MYGYCDKRCDYRFFKLTRINNLIIINEDTIHTAPSKILLTKNTVNEFAIGLYSDYTEDKNWYCITVGNEVSSLDENNKNLDVKIIPAGKYAKFSICGNMVTAVVDAWQQIWQMDLDRSFTGDFEEYKNADVENAEIDIYVALK